MRLSICISISRVLVSAPGISGGGGVGSPPSAMTSFLEIELKVRGFREWSEDVGEEFTPMVPSSQCFVMPLFFAAAWIGREKTEAERRSGNS